MLTNLPMDETGPFHPIAFYDQGTSFFETRQRLDGDALFRCGFRPPLERRTSELENGGFPRSKEGRQGRTEPSQDHRVPGYRPIPPPGGPMMQFLSVSIEWRPWTFGISWMRARAAFDLRSKQMCNEKNSLILDPIHPLKRLTATSVYSVQAATRGSALSDVQLACRVRCPNIAAGTWSLLAILGPEQVDRLHTAVGGVPPKPPGFGEEEWMLRHAFADERVRENSFLACTLARLPLLFARASAGGVRFRSPLVPPDHIPRGHNCRLIAVVDTGVYGDDT